MERQIIDIKIVTEGEKCEMTTDEIKSWYEKNITALFNKDFGEPVVEVKVERVEL